MDRFKILNTKKTGNLLFQVLEFTNGFPLPEDYPNRESAILNAVHKLLNVIYSLDITNSKFRATGVFGLEGNKEEIDVIDRSDIFIQKLFNELKNNLSDGGLVKLIGFCNHFLEVREIRLFQKTNVIDAENRFLKDRIELFIEIGEEDIVREFISSRLEVIFNAIYSYDEVIRDDFHFNQDKRPLYNLLNLYFDYKTNRHLNSNQIFQAFNSFKEELEVNEDEEIKKILIQRLIDINSRFLLEPNSSSCDLLEEYKELFSEDEIAFLEAVIKSNPNDIDVQAFQFTQGNISESDVKHNTIHTIIRFSIPYWQNDSKYGSFQLDEQISIEYQQLENKLEDPIFKAYKDLSIGGIGWNFYSDSFQADIKYTTIAFIISDFYNPDLMLTSDGYNNIDFSEKKALLGRDYYPHKEFVIQYFLKNSEKICNVFGVKKEEININLFSNFIVDYIDVDNEKLIYRRLYSITNPDSFNKASNRFIDRLDELKLSDAYIPIRDLVEKASITSDRSLSLFIQSLLDIVIKNNIELHSNYKYFWKLDSENNRLIPQNEPDMQPLIMGQLKAICDFMGIQVSREVESANGEIDFLCSYTYNRAVLKTCIELKNAHSPKIEHGLTKQLPQYLKSERTKSGIYLVLWYKGDNFPNPINYPNHEALLNNLLLKRPREFDIKIVIINCNKPIVPSKIK